MLGWPLALCAGFGALAASGLFAASAGADGDPHAAAVAACAAANAKQPASLVTAVDDGRGGSLVWLTDAESGLWLCSAGKDGKIYAYSLMAGDLLQGAGAGLIDLKPVSDGAAVVFPDPDPAEIALKACQIKLDGVKLEVIGHGMDGLRGNWVPGYFVFIETGEGRVYLCDATADAQVWAFAEIGAPLTVVALAG
jgi:outer membrane protein assembly factor BamB